MADIRHDGGAGPFLAATVFLWRPHEDPVWRTGDINLPRTRTEDLDASAQMFRLLTEETPDAYWAYAADYFEVTLNPGDVRQIFEDRHPTADLVRRINADTDLTALTKTLQATRRRPRVSIARQRPAGLSHGGITGPRPLRHCGYARLRGSLLLAAGSPAARPVQPRAC